MEAPNACLRCQSRKLVQDEDVLDTWFSSALWPFATMGWPEETEDIRTFYPTDLMSTGFDIIFFWVARMIMMGLKFMKAIPFRHVFINGLVRDVKRRKMSKSEGNIIDPLEMIEKYGTDALRFTLTALAIPGMDLSLSEERMAGYRAFANKIWNASRFVLMNLEEDASQIRPEELTLADRWILARLDEVTDELNAALEEYKFYEAADRIYHFIWDEFCDWYIELVKPALEQGNKMTAAVLAKVLDQILRLLHPFMPFITEEIWQHLPTALKSLALASFPRGDKRLRDENAKAEMKLLQEMIVEVRTMRAENKITPKKGLRLWIKSENAEARELLERHRLYIQKLANVTEIEFRGSFPPEEQMLKGVAEPWEVAIPLEGMFDTDQEKQRLERELAKAAQEIEKVEARLNNADFTSRAPEGVIKATKVRLDELRLRRKKTQESLSRIIRRAKKNK
jgi:valyl-tRNA synthetase